MCIWVYPVYRLKSAFLLVSVCHYGGLQVELNQLFHFRLELCSFSGYKIHPGHGRRLVRVDGTLPFPQARVLQ
jgi:hypothetical protein